MNKTYIDSRGWIYFVRAGIGTDTFKAFYRKPGKIMGEHGVKSLPWRDTAEEAQRDLDEYAAKKGWREAGS